MNDYYEPCDNCGKMGDPGLMVGYITGKRYQDKIFCNNDECLWEWARDTGTHILDDNIC